MTTEAVTKQTIINGIYTNFYAIVSVLEPTNIFSRIFPSMPDIELNEKNSYPIILLESPINDLNQFSMGKNLTEGTINFYVFTLSAKLRDQIIDKIVYAIETNKGVLATKNLHQVNIDKISYDEIARGKIKVHFCTIPIKFKFYSDKTFAY
jgi:hypothetical protein